MKRIAYTLTTLGIAAVMGILWMGSQARAIPWVPPTTQPPVRLDIGANVTTPGTLTATLAATASKTTYIEGFDLTYGGATSASVITVTVTGTTNTLSYTVNVLGSATGPGTAQPLSVRFPTPIPSSAVNTAIVVTVPSTGSGNTSTSVSAYGFAQ